MTKERAQAIVDRDAVLSALWCLTRPHGEMCIHFAPIERSTGMPRQKVRRLCRLLKRQGMAEFYAGLISELSGEFCGAGYCISSAGVAKCEMWWPGQGQEQKSYAE